MKSGSVVSYKKKTERGQHSGEEEKATGGKLLDSSLTFHGNLNWRDYTSCGTEDDWEA